MYTEPLATKTLTLTYAGGQTVTIEVPTTFDRSTFDQRRAWGREQIECSALDILRDFGAAHGRVATSTQKELFLEAVRPGIEAALKGGSR